MGGRTIVHTRKSKNEQQSEFLQAFGETAFNSKGMYKDESAQAEHL